MKRPVQLARPQPVLRSCGLLVGALLLGLLGMHGLGPVPESVGAHGHDRTVTVTASMDMDAVTAAAPGTCDHGGGDCQGHAKHADPTCASASVAGAPGVAPVLMPDVMTCAGVPLTRTSPGGSGPDGGRAPPLLAELQLLRI
ncbi:DUF6153 family protein [Streptomyces sp. DSM 40750]|uniref:DUF6153 family protein n=1 Tax=Streptomyces sp. DSM 40750 TaxID=2801030 RepID=UPI00214B685D|nr:DUF6153 family protein [Streptomyces sp. DSM 40750]UUU25240.1 DUF6153 family protein [Streptomyces sp. DSM 40750]